MPDSAAGSKDHISASGLEGTRRVWASWHQAWHVGQSKAGRTYIISTSDFNTQGEVKKRRMGGHPSRRENAWTAVRGAQVDPCRGKPRVQPSAVERPAELGEETLLAMN